MSSSVVHIQRTPLAKVVFRGTGLLSRVKEVAHALRLACVTTNSVKEKEWNKFHRDPEGSDALPSVAKAWLEITSTGGIRIVLPLRRMRKIRVLRLAEGCWDPTDESRSANCGSFGSPTWPAAFCRCGDRLERMHDLAVIGASCSPTHRRWTSLEHSQKCRVNPFRRGPACQAAAVVLSPKLSIAVGAHLC
ncbi:hypothetical protein ABIB73_003308 [Bradyrhizobium sp. F1.4.3]